MWDTANLTSRGGTSVRRIFTYALTAFIAAFLWILVSSPLAHAADASWSGSSITYQGNPYIPETADGTKPPGLKKDTTYYLYDEVTDVISGNGVADIIYFPTGSPNTATSATFEQFQVDSSGTYGKKVSTKTISLVAKTASTSSSKATWDGTNILYDSLTYTGQSGSPYIATSTSNPTLTTGTQYYEHQGDPDLLGNSTVSIIYFPAGTIVQNETSASYAVYSVDSSLNWKLVGSVKTIAITPNVNGGSTSTSTSTTDPSSCTVDEVGWIVCPISNFLAKGMDTIFSILEGYLVVKPIATQTDSSLYQAWNYIRSIANVAFVIAFLIIIYSQITNIGIGNYSIKKLLPRLIIAAILVNISYYICAIAVDLSNVIGASLNDMLGSIRDRFSGPNTNSLASWQSVSGFILSGGTLVGAGLVGIAAAATATGASIGAAVILLLPMLVALILAVLVALVVLAARQALIIILIIGAPIAFVFYLLPNTEKWFTWWRKTFMTLLVFYPLFALIFGGSQLAGFIIRQNADQINVVLLGMFVQVAPLVITPLLIRFSGDVVGRVAGLVNNPKKGLVDRTRNWSKEQSEYLAARNMARTDPVRNRQVFRRFALGADQDRRIREGRKAMYTERSDARWTNSAEYRAIDQDQRFAKEQKEYGEQVSEAQYATTRTVAGAVRNLDLQLKDVKAEIDTLNVRAEVDWNGSLDPVRIERKLDLRAANSALETIKALEDSRWEEIKAGRVVAGYPTTANMARVAGQVARDTEEITVNGMRSAAAKRRQLQIMQEQFSDTATGQALRRQAAGIDNVNGKGEMRILADVRSQIQAEKDTLVKNIKIATEVKTGDVAGYTNEFRKAVTQGNAEAARAYADLLAAAANPGVSALRKVIAETELRMPTDVLVDLKTHINSDATINAAAEDIATWSRDEKSRQLHDITTDGETWKALTAAAFAGLKKSSQEAALLTGAITPATANAILTGPAKQNLKPDMEARIRRLARNDPSYKESIEDPFKP